MWFVDVLAFSFKGQNPVILKNVLILQEAIYLLKSDDKWTHMFVLYQILLLKDKLI